MQYTSGEEEGKESENLNQGTETTGFIVFCVHVMPSHREEHKIFLVVLSNAVVHPGTVVVHLFDAAFAHTADTREMKAKLRGGPTGRKRQRRHYSQDDTHRRETLEQTALHHGVCLCVCVTLPLCQCCVYRLSDLKAATLCVIYYCECVYCSI